MREFPHETTKTAESAGMHARYSAARPAFASGFVSLRNRRVRMFAEFLPHSKTRRSKCAPAREQCSASSGAPKPNSLGRFWPEARTNEPLPCSVRVGVLCRTEPRPISCSEAKRAAAARTVLALVVRPWSLLLLILSDANPQHVCSALLARELLRRANISFEGTLSLRWLARSSICLSVSWENLQFAISLLLRKSA